MLQAPLTLLKGKSYFPYLVFYVHRNPADLFLPRRRAGKVFDTYLGQKAGIVTGLTL